MRGLAAAGVVSLALLCAACGGGRTGHGPDQPGSVPESASFIPVINGEPFFTVLDSDLDGDRWGRVLDMLDRFPDGPGLLAGAKHELAKQGLDWDGIAPALGPELGEIEADGTLLVNQPDDPSRFAELVAKANAAHPERKFVIREVDGWTLAGDSTFGLDDAEKAHAGKSLADDPTFRELMTKLPGDAVARLYVGTPDFSALVDPKLQSPPSAGLNDPDTILTAAALTVTDATVEAQLITRMKKPPARTEHAPALATEVPADAIAFLSFDRDSLDLLRAPFGFLCGFGGFMFDASDFLTGEGALYVRPGSPIPEVTLVLDHPAASARGRVTELVRRAAGGAGEPVTVDGVPALRFTGTGVPVYVAAFAGKLVVTDSRTGIEGLRDDGPRLADDDGYKEALDEAGVPGRVGALLYAEPERIASVAEPVAKLAGTALPPLATRNLQPVQTLVAYLVHDGRDSRLTVVAGIEH